MTKIEAKSCGCHKRVGTRNAMVILKRGENEQKKQWDNPSAMIPSDLMFNSHVENAQYLNRQMSITLVDPTTSAKVISCE